jgi:GTP-binding protein HflX
LELPSGQTILMTDTVGFIQKLPTQLVAAFRATLEEIKEANLLLHVVDLSHPQHGIQEWTVLETLKEIGADQLPILTVYNKADLVELDEIVALRHDAGPNALVISALTGEGIPTLLERISTEIYAGYELMDLLIPFNRGDLVSEFHEKGHVTALEHQDNGVHIRGYLPEQVLARYAPFKRRD